MREHTKQLNPPPISGRWRLMMFAVVLALTGLILLVRGATLMALGGSWYYAITGLLLLISGVLLGLRRMAAVWVYAAVFVGTLLWALWEVGLSFWPLVPRLAPMLVFGFIFALLLPALNHGYKRQHTLILAGVLLLVMVIGGAWMFRPHGVIRQPSTNFAHTNQTQIQEDENRWQYYGRTPRGTRFVPHAQINKDNVADLQIAWTFRTGEPPERLGAFQNTPLHIDNTLYVCTPLNKVFALNADNGEQRWMFDPEPDNAWPFRPRCRGIGYYEPAVIADDHTAACARRIVLTTVDARLMELDANTGQPCTDFGHNGTVNLSLGMGEIKPSYYFPTSMPTVIGNLIVVGGWVIDNQEVNEPSGVIRAFNADNGELVWAWDLGNPEVTGPPPPQGYSRGTPNMWSTPAFDEELGLIYLPLGNGTPDFWVAHRSEETNVHASSVVALEIETGRKRWLFQTVHIDTWDYDVASQPALYDIPDGKGGMIPALIQATKTGQIFVLNRRDGTPIFPVEERPAPPGRGHVFGDIAADTQPFSVGLPMFGGNTLRERDMWGATFFDQLECRIAFKRLNYEGLYTRLHPDAITMLYPGFDGGMNWGGVAIDEQHGLLIVNDIRIPILAAMVPQDSTLPASSGIRNPIVYPQRGTPYSVHWGMFFSPVGIPCHAPPWGVIAAVDLRTGALVWQRPAGSIQDVTLAGVKVRLPMPVGMPTLGGPLITSAGLVFHGGTQDYYLRAYDVHTGDALWKGRLPVGAQATPMSYISSSSGRQFVVIAAGGAPYPHSTEPGDYIVAYALPAE